MPLYASVVLIGAARFLETTLAIDFDVALLIYSVIIRTDIPENDEVIAVDSTGIKVTNREDRVR